MSVTTYNKQDPYQQILAEFLDITNPNGKIGCPSTCINVFHYIETKGQPIFAKPRRLRPERLTAAKEEFRIMCSQGLCRPSSSNYASPLHIVEKSNGELRYCGDYRALNAITVPDRFPIPYVQDLTYNLHGKTIFSVIDLRKAYYQIPVHPDDIPKSAITTPFGLFEFCVLTFGLRNAAQTFQRYMMQIFQDLDFVFIYIDDICISSIDSKQHKHHLRIVFKRLRQHKLSVNVSKCQFGQSSVKFLGKLVDENGVHPLPEKISAIRDFQRAKTVRELKRLLAMINFYRRFIPNAAETQDFLQKLMPGNKKNDTTEILWTDDSLVALEKCKSDLINATTLSHPAANFELSLSVDASDSAVGAVVHQQDGMFCSHSPFFLKNSRQQKRYSTYDR